MHYALHVLDVPGHGISRIPFYCPLELEPTTRACFNVQWRTKCAVMNENVEWWKAVFAVMNKWLRGGKVEKKLKNSVIWCWWLKQRDFGRKKAISGLKSQEGNISVEMCSHEFFLKHALPTTNAWQKFELFFFLYETWFLFFCFTLDM